MAFARKLAMLFGMSKNDPFLEEDYGPSVVGLINWMVRSLDVSELSKEEMLTLFMMLSRAMAALWRGFEFDLSILVGRHFAQMAREILQDDEFDNGDLEDESDDGEPLDASTAPEDKADGSNRGNGSNGSGPR